MWHIMFVDTLRHVFGTIRQLLDMARPFSDVVCHVFDTVYFC